MFCSQNPLTWGRFLIQERQRAILFRSKHYIPKRIVRFLYLFLRLAGTLALSSDPDWLILWSKRKRGKIQNEPPFVSCPSLQWNSSITVQSSLKEFQYLLAASASLVTSKNGLFWKLDSFNEVVLYQGNINLKVLYEIDPIRLDSFIKLHSRDSTGFVESKETG